MPRKAGLRREYRYCRIIPQGDYSSENDSCQCDATEEPPRVMHTCEQRKKPSKKEDRAVVMEWYKERVDELSMKPPVYSCCGDDCAVCPRYIAETEDELKQTARFWHEVGWRDHVVSNDEIRCKGCGTRNICSFMILPCMNEHAVSKCRECSEYPCEKIDDMLRRSAIKEEECRKCCTDEAEWQMLKRAFYEKEKNLNVEGRG